MRMRRELARYRMPSIHQGEREGGVISCTMGEKDRGASAAMKLYSPPRGSDADLPAGICVLEGSAGSSSGVVASHSRRDGQRRGTQAGKDRPMEGMKRRVVVTGWGSSHPLGTGIQKTWEGICKGASGIDRITTSIPRSSLCRSLVRLRTSTQRISSSAKNQENGCLHPV